MPYKPPLLVYGQGSPDHHSRHLQKIFVDIHRQFPKLEFLQKHLLVRIGVPQYYSWAVQDADVHNQERWGTYSEVLLESCLRLGCPYLNTGAMQASSSCLQLWNHRHHVRLFELARLPSTNQMRWLNHDSGGGAFQACAVPFHSSDDPQYNLPCRCSRLFDKHRLHRQSCLDGPNQEFCFSQVQIASQGRSASCEILPLKFGRVLTLPFAQSELSPPHHASRKPEWSLHLRAPTKLKQKQTDHRQSFQTADRTKPELLHGPVLSETIPS